MSNDKKLFIFFALLIVLVALSVALFSIKNEQSKIAEKELIKQQLKEKEEPKVEFHGETMITLASTLNKSLEHISYRDKIIDKSVDLTKKLVDEYLTKNIPVTNAVIMALSLVETGTAGNIDSISMYNIELLLTTHTGEKIEDNSTYLIYLSRWDEGNEAHHFVSAINERFIKENYSKYADAEEYNKNIFVAASVIETHNYMKSVSQHKEEELSEVAFLKANAYASTLDNVTSVTKVDFVVSQETDDLRSYTFKTDNDNITIIVYYTFFDDIDVWSYRNTIYSEIYV